MNGEYEVFNKANTGKPDEALHKTLCNEEKENVAGVDFKKMGLPKAEKATQTSITFNQDIREWLKVVSKEQGYTVSGFVNVVMRQVKDANK